MPYGGGKKKEMAATPFKILLDAMIIKHRWTHVAKWESHGIQKWGPHDVQTGIVVDIPKPKLPPEEEWLQEQKDALPKLCSLVRSGDIQFFTDFELRFEQMGLIIPQRAFDK